MGKLGLPGLCSACFGFRARTVLRLLTAVVICIGLVSSARSDSSCTPVRLDGAGGPLKDIPVTNQGGTPLCEAYAACQALDSVRFHAFGPTALRLQCSPVSLSSQIAAYLEGLPGRSTDPLGIMGPSPEQLLFHASKVRVCSERRFMEALARSSTVCNELSFNYALMRDEPARYVQRASAWCHFPLTPGGMYSINALLAKAFGTNSDRTLDVSRAIADACADETIELPKVDVLRTKVWEIAPERREAEIRLALNARLDQDKPVPPIVKYCVHALFDKSIIGAQDGKLDGRLCNRNGKHGLHASVVVGRRFNPTTSSCEYLIRNSEGTSCSGYDSRLECDRTWGGVPCPPGRRCGGQVWLPIEVLAKNISTVVGVVPR